MKKSILMAIIILSVSMLGCISATHSPSIYFYYSTNCPWCKLVKPYMELLKSKVNDIKFEFCNVKDFKNCSSDARELAEKVKLRYIPTVIVKDSNLTILTGAYEVLKVGKILRSYGYDVPVNFTINGLNYSVEDCVRCHANMSLAPSTYNCSYCCHKT